MFQINQENEVVSMKNQLIIAVLDDGIMHPSILGYRYNNKVNKFRKINMQGELKKHLIKPIPA